MTPAEVLGAWAVRVAAGLVAGTAVVAAVGLWVRLFRACAGV